MAGTNVVVSADQEFNNFLFQQEEKTVVLWYLDLFEKVFDFQGDFRPEGLTIHKYMRSSVLSHFGVESMKQNLLSQFEKQVRTTLDSWSTRDSINLEPASVAVRTACMIY